MSMLANWTDEHSKAFQKEIMPFEHNLESTGLFTDEALITLLEKHPASKLDVCSMGNETHELYPNKMRTGDFRETDGKTLLAAAKSGLIWINVREAMNVHPEYEDVLDKMYGGIAKETGRKVYNARGGILISSPAAKVPYHFDKTETILWHVRGKKSMYLYPLTPEFISDIAYENALLDEFNDDLPYKAEFDNHATVFDFKPGQALSWPMNMPHKVENRSFCVSVTTEYSTVASSRRNAAMLTNAAIRQRFGMNPSYWNSSPTENYVKSIFGKVIKKVGVVSKSGEPDFVSFKIDGNAEDYIVDVEPFERNF